MPINTEELMNAVQELSAQENLRVTVVESAKGACIAGGCALIGGIMGGPLGLGLGGMFGSVMGAIQGQNKYKSVVEVIREDMTLAQKEKLIRSLMNILSDVTIEDSIRLTVVLLNPSVKYLLIKEISEFLKNEMGLRMLPF